MITVDGVWVLEGLDRKDKNRIKNHKELSEYINEIGFLPLFKNNIKGFSVEEITAKDSWWSGNTEEDPWNWREIIASEGKIAYGKLYSNKAGFVSKAWYPAFATYRRDGYDFDSRYEDGQASRKAKLIMDILTEYETLPSYKLKALAGFCKEGEKGFEGVMASLQMQAYIAVRSFNRRLSKKNEEYGWSVASYSLSERLFGEEYVRSEYHLGAEAAKEKIILQILNKFPGAAYQDIAQCIR